MSTTEDAIATLIAKEEIRELAMLYSRGIDRKDPALLRTLYTDDGLDIHGYFFKGSAKEYLDKIEQALPHMPYSGHHICNHLISVDGDTGEGEVYAIAWHVIPDGQGGFVEHIDLVRYCDQYRKVDGRWKFARRDVMFDAQHKQPTTGPDNPDAEASYTELKSRLFARGGPRI